ncbi:PAS domain-containing protein [Caballeronia sp. LZ035]|uniref:PAS domain-containing protein n=1 Tax=Caballeronia sp. LZ035 TaxID=3038568 RepID=UPI0028637A3B|nr:PAS domain-containing protein [Caballeronia sp. LZ035]MDR5760982.1 hypothetical protein [Caballeronia sp. LZ035]
MGLDTGRAERTPYAPPQSCDAVLATQLLKSNMPFVAVNRDGRIVEQNDALTGLIGEHARSNAALPVFGVDRSTLFDTDRSEPICGSCESATGEIVPLILHPLYRVKDWNDAMLVAIVDGTPFRAGELQRFESTPYTILRVTDSIVRFANDEAQQTLGPTSGSLIGKRLTDMFEDDDRSAIENGLQRCETERTAVPLDVTIKAPVDAPWRDVRLILTPDMMPDRRLLGVLAVIKLTTLDLARDRIRRIMIAPSSPDHGSEHGARVKWQERFASVVQQLARLFEFDHAILGVYAHDPFLFKAVEIESGEKGIRPPKDELWPARWMDLPHWSEAWLSSGKTWVPSVDEFTQGDEVLRDSEIVKSYRRYGIASAVTLPAFGSSKITSSLTLCSKHAGKYDEVDLKKLRELDLEPVLLRFEQEMRDEQTAFAEEIKQSLASATPLPEKAVSIVTRIAEHFHWEYVGLLRVNRHEELFKLVSQQPPDASFSLKPDFRQPISDGMLARTLKESKILVVDEIGNPDVEQYDYITLNQSFRSAMTIPLRLNKRTRWVIDVESRAAHAFRGPDHDEIVDIISIIEEGLTAQMLVQMKKVLLKTSEQGIVITGFDGSIIEMNPIAGVILGEKNLRPAESESIFLNQYLSDTDQNTLDVLARRTVRKKQRLELKSDGSRRRAVQASRYDLKEAFDVEIWLLTDLREEDWSRDLRFLRSVVAEVAQETRAPLTLASTLARQLPQLLKASGDALGRISGPGSVTERLVSEICKADITFERLAEGLSIREEPRRTSDMVNLPRCLRDIVGVLPERDRSRIELTSSTPQALLVKGDEGRLAFVMRSIVGYLLRIRSAENAKVIVDIAADSGRAISRFALNEAVSEGGSQGSPDPEDPLWNASRLATGDVSLSLEAIEDVIHAHDGKLDREPPDTTRSGALPIVKWFVIELPLVGAGGQP